MIRIAICDDEPNIVNKIEDLLLKIGEQENIPICTDAFYGGKTLEQEIRQGTRYDLIYLDIQMERGDGIVTAREIRKLDENVLLIYISGYDKYLMELFRLDVFAFMKKPIIETEFMKTFMEANQRICSKKIYFSFRYKNEEYKILCQEILYFESKGRQIIVHLRNEEKHYFNDKLSEVENKLADGKIPFLRIHQSYLVNYHLILSRSKTEVTMVDGSRLAVSGDRQKEFNRKYAKLLGGEIDV